MERVGVSTRRRCRMIKHSFGFTEVLTSEFLKLLAGLAGVAISSRRKTSAYCWVPYHGLSTWSLYLRTF